MHDLQFQQQELLLGFSIAGHVISPNVLGRYSHEVGLSTKNLGDTYNCAMRTPSETGGSETALLAIAVGIPVAWCPPHGPGRALIRASREVLTNSHPTVTSGDQSRSFKDGRCEDSCRFPTNALVFIDG